MYDSPKVKEETEIGGSKKAVGAIVECKKMGKDVTCFVNTEEINSKDMADAIQQGLFTEADAKKGAAMVK